MKKYILLLVTSCLLLTSISVQTGYGQDKTKPEKEKDIQKSIEEQKKAMSEQKKAQKEVDEDLKQQQIEMENSVNAASEDMDNADMERAKIYMRLPRNDRSFNFEQPMIWDGGDMGMYGHMGDSERTTWDFSKSVKENTFTRDYTFDVEKTVKSVVMSVMGDCKSGDIRIKILMPNGKSYSDILIDESGNLNWRKSFTISETENQDKTGEWKFQISSSKATGYFKISLQSY